MKVLPRLGPAAMTLEEAGKRDLEFLPLVSKNLKGM